MQIFNSSTSTQNSRSNAIVAFHHLGGWSLSGSVDLLLQITPNEGKAAQNVLYLFLVAMRSSIAPQQVVIAQVASLCNVFCFQNPENILQSLASRLGCGLPLMLREGLSQFGREGHPYKNVTLLLSISIIIVTLASTCAWKKRYSHEEVFSSHPACS